MDADALRTMDDVVVEKSLPDRPIASLRDLEVLYGALYTLGRGLTGEYGPYLTPDAAADQVGSEALLVVRVDLRGDTPTLGDPPVTMEMYPDDLVSAVGHSKYSASNGIDHSITHQSGQDNGPEKHADHATRRLTSWPTKEPIKQVASDYENGWAIDALGTLGSDEPVKERIRESVLPIVPQEDQVLHTVAVAFDGDEITTTDEYRPDAEYHYPGEIEVFQEAMAARKTWKFRSKSDTDNAIGQGTCFVYDTDETVYGVVDDPMKHYLSKQMEKFPQLDADESWRTQGLSRDAAIRAQSAETFLDACNVTTAGTSTYYLPYPPGTLDAEDASALYNLLVRQVEEDEEERNTPIGRNYLQLKKNDELGELRFYLAVVSKYQKDRWRVIASTPDASARIPADLADAHRETLKGPWIGGESGFPAPDGFPLLAAPDAESLIDITSSVGYLSATCQGEDADDPSSDDIRFRGTATIAAGQPLDVEELLREYVAHLVDRFDPEGEYPFPSATLAMQYAQLSTLASCSLLDGPESLTTPPTYMTDNTTQEPKRSRTEAFEQFIEDHPPLANEARRGVFGLGALVGRLSRYQKREGKSMTAVSQYPIDNVTKHNLPRIATEVVEKNVVYSGEEGYRGTMYAELMDVVVDGMESGEPSEWSLSTDDLRFHYAMGIAYGMNDRSSSEYDDD